jgi:glycosyltransferase involved in cell wall biosynthesis
MTCNFSYQQKEDTVETGQRIALWSADYSENTGQALVTRHVTEKILPMLGGSRVYVFLPSGRPLSILSWIRTVARLWRDRALRRFDALYLVCSRSNAGFIRDLPALLLSQTGIRIIVHSHGSDIISLLNGRLISPLARRAYRHCELVVPSMHVISALTKTPLAALHLCENFSKTSQHQIERPARGPALSVLWNSNIMASKGAFDLFEAVHQLKRQGLSIDLKAIGRVLADDEFTQPIAEAALANVIEAGVIDFIGAVSADRAVQLLSNFDVVALPSRYSSELQPLALIEAMCNGCAIVAADTPALRATLGNYPADFVPVRSIQALAEALSRLDAEKTFDPIRFVSIRSGHAAVARKRFSRQRFDHTLTEIFKCVDRNRIRNWF